MDGVHTSSAPVTGATNLPRKATCRSRTATPTNSENQMPLLVPQRSPPTQLERRAMREKSRQAHFRIRKIMEDLLTLAGPNDNHPTVKDARAWLKESEQSDAYRTQPRGK